jgi:hypothetical protein
MRLFTFRCKFQSKAVRLQTALGAEAYVTEGQ